MGEVKEEIDRGMVLVPSGPFLSGRDFQQAMNGKRLPGELMVEFTPGGMSSQRRGATA